MITDVFLDQKRVNVCEHMVKTAPHNRFGSATKVDARQDEGRSGVDEGKIVWESK